MLCKGEQDFPLPGRYGKPCKGEKIPAYLTKKGVRSIFKRRKLKFDMVQQNGKGNERTGTFKNFS
jgi:hypothetical protein